MKTNPNEPISPFTELDEQGRPFQFYLGLTKREHFVGLAMQGLLSNASSALQANGERHTCESLMRVAIFMTDALIKELNKES